MSDSKKKAASLIVDSLGASKPKVASDKGEVDSNPGLSAAAEDLIAAVHSKDSKGVKNAMKSIYEMHRNEDDSSDDSHETGPFQPDEESASAD